MAYSQEQRMIDTQANLISKLNADIKRLQQELDDEREKQQKNEKAAEFYFALQKSIKENTILQSEWKRFLMFLKMAEPEC